MLEGSMGFFPPGVFSMAAIKHMERYGTTREQIAQVAVKNNYNGSLNPKAHYQKTVTLEQVLNSRPVSYPLNVLDCCPISDGCAAVILCGADVAKRFSGNPVRLLAAAHKSGTYKEDPELDADTLERLRAQLGEEMNAICTGCGYCLKDCPQQIPVASYMQYYNQKALFGKSDEEMIKGLPEQYEWQLLAARQAQAADCNECGQCDNRIPEKIS